MDSRTLDAWRELLDPLVDHQRILANPAEMTANLKAYADFRERRAKLAAWTDFSTWALALAADYPDRDEPERARIRAELAQRPALRVALYGVIEEAMARAREAADRELARRCLWLLAMRDHGANDITACFQVNDLFHLFRELGERPDEVFAVTAGLSGPQLANQLERFTPYFC